MDRQCVLKQSFVPMDWLTKQAAAWVMLGALHAGLVLGDDPPKQSVPSGVSGPFSTDESQRLFQLGDERLQIELVAGDSLVQDPVAGQFDEDGRLWVVEMGDYPHGPKPGEAPKSRIKVLSDQDGDGKFEKSTIFAEKLLFVTELQPWNGGAIVTLAGEIAYFRDTNGDGKADHRETWYRGFAEENSQLRANHPRLGLDGWIYVSNGLRGGTAKNARVADSPVIRLAGKDFRFHPKTAAYEAVTGVGQFGLTFDDYGNRFICSNRNPLMHVVLEERYIQRNPKYAPAAARHDVGLAGEASRIYAISRAWTTSNLHAGQFTAACGVLIYRGTGLPTECYGNGFTCDPTGNLVHREAIQPAGATFTHQPQNKQVEFLASPDEWFRPVNLFNGPDGALYVVDMYRAVIEHPDFVPDELKKRPDQMLGVDRGRIWRVISKESPRLKMPKLSIETGSQLVARLESPGWIGDTAFRLIYERQEKSLAGELERVAAPGKGVGAVRALWLLQHLDSLQESTLTSALQATDARVREQAIELAELHFVADPTWRKKVIALAGDEDPKVRFQVALSLAPVANQEELLEGLKPIAVAGAEDEWTRRAIAIAAGNRAGELAASLLLPAAWPKQQLSSDAGSLLRELFGVAAVQRDATQLAQLLGAVCRLDEKMAPARIQRPLLLSLVEAVGRNGQPLSQLVKQLSEEDKRRWEKTLDRAKATLRDGTDVEERAAAAQLLGYDEQSTGELFRLAHDTASTGGTPTELRLRALSALGRQTKFNQWPELLVDWPRESPAFRRGLLDALLARPERTRLLLDAIEAGKVKPSELESSVSSRLLKHGQADIRSRSEKLLASLVPADRQKVLAEYQPILEMKADSVRGKQVFVKNCALCHRIGKLGVNVAPDISDSRVKQPAQLLADILQPNRAIDNNYLSYTVVTSDGLTLTGVIASETGTSITLRQQEGKDAVLLRSNIEELRSNGVSLMPEGLEKNIPMQDMADLISFIKNWRYLDGRTPLSSGD